MSPSATQRAIDAVWRIESVRLIAGLTRIVRDVAVAEDLAQDALVAALEQWPTSGIPEKPGAWLMVTAKRRGIDELRRRVTFERRRELIGRELEILQQLDQPDLAAQVDDVQDDVLRLIFMTCHPVLSREARVALTLRLLGGLSTPEIARAFLASEGTVAQRIVRAKRTLAEAHVPFELPGREELTERLSAVLEVLYLVFNEGYGGDLDLAAEAIRLTRQIAARTDEPEVAGLLALMLLHHARRRSRTDSDGRLIPLTEQDRSLWNTRLISEGVDILQTALARERLGEYQAQAAIAALHADARDAVETDWVQIAEWYDELVRITDSPVARLGRAVAIGEAHGPRAGLTELAALDSGLPRFTAASAHLRERAGQLELAAQLYAEAAGAATSVAERDHLIRQAARVREQLDGPVDAARPDHADRDGGTRAAD